MKNSGTVKRVVRDRGFGFIADEQGQEYFFHVSAVEGGPGVFERIQDGQACTFEIGDSKKGPRAEHIRVNG